MLAKILALVDFFAIGVVLLSAVLPLKVIIYGGGFLLAKGMFFTMTGNIISVLDIICAVLIILMGFGISNTVLLVIVVLFLLQKAFFSMF